MEKVAHRGGVLATATRYWPITICMVSLGLGAGGAAATLRPTIYTAEARLAVGGTDIAAYTIPGFAYSSKEVASNYARFVVYDQVVGMLPEAVRHQVTSIQGSPIPESNIIRIEGAATSPEAATMATQRAADALTTAVTRATSRSSPAKTLIAYSAVNKQVSDATASLDRLKARLDKLERRRKSTTALAQAIDLASVKLSTLQVQQQALGVQYQSQLQNTTPENKLVEVRPASVVFQDSASRLQRALMAGGTVGMLLAIGATSLLGRRAARRTRRDQEVAKAAEADPFDALLDLEFDGRVVSRPTRNDPAWK